MQARGKDRIALLGQLLSNAAIVVMNEQPDGPNVVLKLLGERQGLSYQSSNPLPQRVVQPLNVTGQATVFAHRLMSFTRDDRNVGFPEIRVDLGTLAINGWNGLPERHRRGPRTIADMTSQDQPSKGHFNYV